MTNGGTKLLKKKIEEEFTTTQREKRDGKKKRENFSDTYGFNSFMYCIDANRTKYRIKRRLFVRKGIRGKASS